jgi:CNT family concentrative nucleoside transporter
MHRLISVLGIAVFIGLAWLISSHKRHVSPRIIIGGLLLQFVFAAFILRTAWGEQVFEAIDVAFRGLLACVTSGTEFVFGIKPRPDDVEYPPLPTLLRTFAFGVLPTIIFFSAFMSIFYYFGVMQMIVGLFARLMQATLGTSGAETLSAAANVFVGQTEAPLVIRPYIVSMTMSELNAVMVCGFATMAGGVLGGLVSMGMSAKHLLAASVMAAPAGLLIAKILQPEVDSPKTLGSVKIDVKDPSNNVLEAIANGTLGGLQLALNVGAMLIVFLALIAVVNALFGLAGDGYWWIAAHLGYVVPAAPAQWSLEALLGWMFRPLAWLIGIEWQDCGPAGQLMGLKMATNEFVAYGRLAEWANPESAVQISDRSRTILMYALCGFANFSSIGIQLGGIGGIAPERRGDLARLGLRAMLGGTLTAFINACVANIMLMDQAG